MKLEFLSKFNKDLEKLTNSKVRDSVLRAILSLENANNLNEISNLKKLKGNKFAYRIKLGDYRLGFYFENQIIEIAPIVHRRDIYRVFP